MKNEKWEFASPIFESGRTVNERVTLPGLTLGHWVSVWERDVAIGRAGNPWHPCNPATSSGYFQLWAAMSHVPGLIIFDIFYVICMPFFKSRYFFKIWFFFSVFNYSASKYAMVDSVRGLFRKWLLFFIFIFFIGKSIVPLFSSTFISCFEIFLDVESRDKHVKRSRYKNGWLVKVDPKL